MKVPFIFCARLIQSLWELDSISPSVVLENTGLEHSVLDRPHSRFVTDAQQRKVYECVSILAKSPWLGFYAGSQSSPIDMGPMGLGLASCETVGEMLAFNEKFLATQCPPCLFEARIRGSHLLIRCVEARPMPPKMQRISAEEVLGVWASFPIPGLIDLIEELRVRFNKPLHAKHLAEYAALLPGGLDLISFSYAFGREKRRVLIEAQLPVEAVHFTMPNANEAINDANREYCQTLLENLDSVGSLVDKVYDLLIENFTKRTKSVWFPKDVADALGMSLKTLERKLGKEGTSPSTVISLVRKLLIENYVCTQLTNKQLGKLIGFSNDKSFASWFKKSFDCTRTEYCRNRRQH